MVNLSHGPYENPAASVNKILTFQEIDHRIFPRSQIKKRIDFWLSRTGEPRTSLSRRIQAAKKSTGNFGKIDFALLNRLIEAADKWVVAPSYQQDPGDTPLLLLG